MKKIIAIAQLCIKELLFEKVFYLFAFFTLAILSISLLLGQMTYTEQGKLTLDFGLAGLEISSVLFSVFVSISVIQKEFVSGSIIFPLTKPISRTTFLIGKYLGQSTVQAGLIFSQGLVLFFATSHMSQAPTFLPLFQTTLFVFYISLIMTAITYFFIIHSGAILTTISAISIYLLGSLNATIEFGLKSNSSKISWKIIKSIVPHFDQFNLKLLATHGVSWGGVEIFWISIYTLVCVVVYLTMASLFFNYRDIQA